MFVKSGINASGELGRLPPPLAGEGWGGGERAHMNVFASLLDLVAFSPPPPSPPSPQRPAGVRARTRSWRPETSLRAACVSGVLIQPGKMALTWMLSLAQAQAS